MFRVLILALVFSSFSVFADKPNILYIFTDDQSIRSVSCYEEAHPWVQTPNIDKLATSGVRFETCYTAAWCQPSRASMLTGKLQHNIDKLKLVDPYPNTVYDPETTPFWPANFREKGYSTACIGKWHLGEDVGHGRDWDYSVIWDRMGPRSNSYAYYHKTLVRTNGGKREPLGGYSTDRYTDLAVDYIAKQKDESKPWFLWLCYGGVHGPFTPAERHKDLYSDAPPAEVPADIFGPREGLPEFMVNFTMWEKNKNGRPKGFDKAVKKYHRAVRSIDDGVGRLMKTLEETSQLENTLVVFTSDQGMAKGQHGSKIKWLPYNATIAAPLIFYYPKKIPAGKVSKEAVNGVDITTTLHSFAGIDLPWKMDGRDLKPIIENPDKSLSQPMLLSSTAMLYGKAAIAALNNKEYEEFKRRKVYSWIMFREGKYKYIRYLKDNCLEEVYNLENDPKEQINLASKREQMELVSELRKKAIEAYAENNPEFANALPEPKILK